MEINPSYVILIQSRFPKTIGDAFDDLTPEGNPAKCSENDLLELSRKDLAVLDGKKEMI